MRLREIRTAAETAVVLGAVVVGIVLGIPKLIWDEFAASRRDRRSR